MFALGCALLASALARGGGQRVDFFPSMPSRPTPLPEIDTYAFAQGQKSIDSLWATSSVVSVIRARTLRKARRFAALVGHFSDPDADIVQRYLEDARARFGDDALAIVRGGSALIKPSEPAMKKAGLRQKQYDERLKFLNMLRERGYADEQIDMEWAAENTSTKIIYHARNGIVEIFMQPIDIEETDPFDDVPPGLFDEE
jgi:hypothetical protein